jgi:hypothetical protein
MFRHIQAYVSNFGDLTVVGRFIERVGAEQSDCFVLVLSHFLEQRFRRASKLLKPFPQARLRRFGQVFKRLFRALLARRAAVKSTR